MTPFPEGGSGGGDLPWPDSARTWRTLLDELPVGVVVLERDGRVAAYDRAQAWRARTEVAGAADR